MPVQAACCILSFDRSIRMKTVCVFTPTYNRAYILPTLYESLVSQTSQDFMWLIVDDGSTDGTCSLVSSWKQEGKVDITYVKKENGGKPRAINTGVALCECPLFFCVDSDDHLVPGAVARIVDDYEAIRDDNRIAGIVALRGTDEHTPMVTWIPDGLTEVKYWDLFEKYHFAGDTSLIHKTEVLRKYPYDVAPGEKFIAETSVYYRLDDHYLMRTDNTILTICHYLPDGLTKNFAKNVRENPIGYRKHKLYCAQRSQTLAGKFRETTLYLVGCRMTGEKGGLSKAPNKVIGALCELPASVAYHTIFGGKKANG